MYLDTIRIDRKFWNSALGMAFGYMDSSGVPAGKPRFYYNYCKIHDHGGIA